MKLKGLVFVLALLLGLFICQTAQAGNITVDDFASLVNANALSSPADTITVNGNITLAGNIVLNCPIIINGNFTISDSPAQTHKVTYLRPGTMIELSNGAALDGIDLKYTNPTGGTYMIQIMGTGTVKNCHLSTDMSYSIMNSMNYVNGINIFGTGEITITDNTFDNLYRGVWIRTGSVGSVTDNRVLGTGHIDMDGSPFDSTGLGAAGVYISRNEGSNNTNFGMDVGNGSQYPLEGQDLLDISRDNPNLLVLNSTHSVNVYYDKTANYQYYAVTGGSYGKLPSLVTYIGNNSALPLKTIAFVKDYTDAAVVTLPDGFTLDAMGHDVVLTNASVANNGTITIANTSNADGTITIGTLIIPIPAGETIGIEQTASGTVLKFTVSVTGATITGLTNGYFEYGGTDTNKVTVTATVPAGKMFSSWSVTKGSTTGLNLATNPLVFTPKENYTIAANFYSSPAAPPTPTAPPALTVSSSSLTLVVGGDTGKLTASESGVTWSTSDPSVAIVSADGTVRAIGAGTVTITATLSDGRTVSCTVTVKEPEEEGDGDGDGEGSGSGSGSGTTTQIDMGIDVLALRNNRQLTLPTLAGFNGFWRTDNPFIADISADGKRLIAKNPGTTFATFTCTGITGKSTTVGDRELFEGAQYKIEVNVRKKSELPTKITLTKYKKTLKVGGSYQIKHSVKPKAALDTEVFYTSRNPAVATVNKHGLVTAIKPGKAKIRVYTTNLKYKTITITVKK